MFHEEGWISLLLAATPDVAQPVRALAGSGPAGPAGPGPAPRASQETRNADAEPTGQSSMKVETKS